MSGRGSLGHFREKYQTSDAAGYYARDRFRSWRRAWLDRKERSCIRRLVARIGSEGGILDAPCGAGRLLSTLGGDRNGPTIGLDGSMAMLQEAGRGEMGVIPLVQGDMRALPFLEDSFEGVLCLRILHRIPEIQERRQLLEELIRISRSWIVISFYDSQTPHAARKRRRGRYDGMTRDSFEAEVKSLGWTVSKYWGMRRFWKAHSQTLALLLAPSDDG